jgi:hypothetical protein
MHYFQLQNATYMLPKRRKDAVILRVLNFECNVLSSKILFEKLVISSHTLSIPIKGGHKNQMNMKFASNT